MYRISKRAAVVLAEITALRQSIPQTQDCIKMQFQSLKDEVVHLSQQLESSKAEKMVISKLLEQNEAVNRRWRNERKLEIIHKLDQLHEREIRELKELKVTKLQSMEVCEKESQQKVGRVRGKLEVLESELQQLAGERSSRENRVNGISRNTILGEDAFSEYCENNREILLTPLSRARQHRVQLDELERQLGAASRGLVQEADLGGLSCPECGAALQTVLQCQDGHVVCPACRADTCPQCPGHVAARFSRNRALEQFLATVETRLQ